MANKNEIIISTEEYKELISKGVPNENEKWFKNKLEEFLLDYFKIDGTSLEIKDNWKFCDDFETWLKLIDREMYKRIFNKLYDDKMKKENDNMKMEKARANKEIDND